MTIELQELFSGHRTIAVRVIDVGAKHSIQFTAYPRGTAREFAGRLHEFVRETLGVRVTDLEVAGPHPRR